MLQRGEEPVAKDLITMEVLPSLAIKEWVSLVKDIILAFSALFTVGLGFYGFNKWLHEHRGKEAFNLIKNLVRESHKLNRTCSALREPVRSAERRIFSHDERVNFTNGERWKMAEKEVFDSRFEAFISANSSYKDALLEARAALGSHVYGAFLEFGKLVTKTVVSVNEYLDLVMADNFVYKDDEDPDLRALQEKFLISPSNREGDQLVTETADARETGEKALLSYLGRKSIRR